MKKTISVLLLIALLSTMLFSCTSKTPDVVASEEAAAKTLETMSWTLEVEGGSAESYTRAEAEAHPLSKIYASMMKSWNQGEGNGTGAMQTSFICEGIKMSEFLADMGRGKDSDNPATSVTYYGQIITFSGAEKFYEDMSFTIDEENLWNDEVLIGWICNKTQLLFDSESYVGIFAPPAVLNFTSNCSVTKIVIE